MTAAYWVYWMAAMKVALRAEMKAAMKVTWMVEMKELYLDLL